MLQIAEIVHGTTGNFIYLLATLLMKLKNGIMYKKQFISKQNRFFGKH